MGRKKIKSSWMDIADDLDAQIDSVEKKLTGSVKYPGARLEWTDAIAKKEMDVEIEDLLNDDYYLGSYNAWPSVKEEIADIWHKRCDYDVIIKRGDHVLKKDSIYALSFTHAKEKAIAKWQKKANEADGIHVYRSNNIHTVCLELPKGTGKDFEMSLMIWLLTREFLIQPRNEFFEPYNLDADTTIAIILLNRTESQAKDVTFKEILPRIRSPFFLDYFPPQINLEEIEETRRYPRELRFPRNLVIFPGSGSAASALGYCIAASCIDEANFMARSSTSKQSIFGSESYDAAAESYADLFQRMESRFGAIQNGQMTYAGLSIVISSSRTTNDFTQMLGRRSQKNKGIYYKRMPYWDRKPLDLCGKTFQFDVTNQSILDPKQAQSDYEWLERQATADQFEAFEQPV